MRALARLKHALDAAHARARLRLEPFWRGLAALLALAAAVMLGWRYVVEIGPEGRRTLFVAEQAVVVAFIVRAAALLLLASRAGKRLREAPVENALALFAGCVLAATSLDQRILLDEPLWRWASGAVKVYLIATQAIELSFYGTARLRISPPVVLLASFVALVGLGTGMLLDPRATPPDRPIDPVDALFTATSAACVTGLSVRDTGTEFTRYGQTVILGLIQVGGLGIMTFAAFFAALFGRGLGIRDQLLMRDMLQSEKVGRLSRDIAFIFFATFAIEAVGAVALYFLDDGAPDGAEIFTAAFHSISAFCNAGFGLYPDGLGRFERNIPVITVFAALIVAGGLGYVVIFDLFGWFVRGVLRATGRLRDRRWRAPFSVQTRLVIATSAVLVLGGATLLFFYEGARGVYAHLEPAEALTNAVFLSISCRTAGFNIAPIGAFGSGAIFVMIALMFVGGSPGSTAGGIKTTTLAVLNARILGLLRQREEIEVFGRTIPRRAIANAIGVAFLQFGFVYALTLALLRTDPVHGLEKLLYESVSAVSTVGFTVGITPSLSPAGKVLVSLGMLAGRLGPLTVMMAMAARPPVQSAFRYPDAKVMIG